MPSAPEKTVPAKAPVKPIVQKPVASAPAQAVQITLSIPSFTFDNKTKLKLPILLIILLFFSFSAVMFEKSNFKTVDLFDLNRTDFNAAKAYSINFMLFAVLLSITLALAMFYGQGISPVLAGLTLPVLLLGSLILGIFFPLLFLAFASIAVVISAAAISASFISDLEFKNVFSASGKAMILLAVLAFFVVSGKVSSNKTFYEDTFFSTLTGTDFASVSVNSSNSTSPAVKSFSKEDFNNTFTIAEMKSALAKIPGITSLNSSTQDRFANVVKEALLTQDAFGRIISKTALPQVSASGQVSSSPSKASLMTVPGVKFFVNNMAAIAGLTAAVLTLIAGVFIRLLSSVITALLAKYVL